ncbi:VOC family protein [Maricaulis salignorans]|uniref:Glyoxalase/Bleomycin resistance protein/Dioxygenase superfamily protein n=1 Tax=Maricaulis salignorans TaxID=144026 RepID=A0A1G9TA61_9PROT|nr:VOC family protein [Maricaulis salignorans]SDM43995.1 Glyoxalase/Bleomycin resistance protein/Dioxygenase superfamily protein [Maricaulis salignorans]
MKTGLLEHVNVTVAKPQDTADLMCRLFDWHIRWAGPSALGGQTAHVGTDTAYIALYSPASLETAGARNIAAPGHLNHIGVVVEDLDAVEARVIKAGYEPASHGDYEPGRRFYFFDENGIEFEVVSYS